MDDLNEIEFTMKKATKVGAEEGAGRQGGGAAPELSGWVSRLVILPFWDSHHFGDLAVGMLQEGWSCAANPPSPDFISPLSSDCCHPPQVIADITKGIMTDRCIAFLLFLVRGAGTATARRGSRQH